MKFETTPTNQPAVKMSDLFAFIIAVIIVVIVIFFIFGPNTTAIIAILCGLFIIFLFAGLLSLLLRSSTHHYDENPGILTDDIAKVRKEGIPIPNSIAKSAIKNKTTKIRKFSTVTTETYPLTPQQIGSVYLGSVPYGGTGMNIGIITCYKYTNVQTDLNSYCSKFGLPLTTLQIHNFATQIDSGWAVETVLDATMAHLYAPLATKHIFMSKDDSYASIATALQQAVGLKMNIITMSFGGDEEQDVINLLEPIFSANPNIIFLAAAGDSDTVSYPSSSPNVISVGGTILTVASNNVNEKNGPTSTTVPITANAYTKLAEENWYSSDGNGSGHGVSSIFTTPPYQAAHNPSTFRSTPDISLIAATPDDAGVLICCSEYRVTPSNPAGPWIGVEGTSVSSPSLAGQITTANAARIKVGKNSLTRTQILTYLYNLAPGSSAVDLMIDGCGNVSSKTIQALVSL